MMYRTDDGQSWMHVNYGRKPGPLPCAAPALDGDNLTLGARCCRTGGKLCDAPAGQDLGGKALTCDMPLCKQHATRVEGKDLDYCPRHAHLAPAPLKPASAESFGLNADMQPVVDELRRRMKADKETHGDR